VKHLGVARTAGGAVLFWKRRTTMLAKPPASLRPPMTFAFVGNYAVRLAANLKCPHCTKPLRACDVEANFGDVRIVCSGCFKDVLVIGAAS
jgi:hypothetical protein